jgi:Nucleoside 2-deoxyribosyltransferase
MRGTKVYLAGPEVFLRNATEVGDRKKALCEAHGLEGLFPYRQLCSSNFVFQLPHRRATYNIPSVKPAINNAKAHGKKAVQPRPDRSRTRATKARIPV